MALEPAPLPSVDFSGKWINELHSEMELVITGNGVTGVYRTHVGQPKPTEAFPLVGFVTGDMISFTVNFGKYGSLTAWVGQHTEPKPGNYAIRTLWQLSKNVQDQDEPEQLWGSVLTGSNLFARN
jgi:hypothetical protein